MMFQVKCAVELANGKSREVEATIKARNGKGAVRLFVLKSEALNELGADIRSISVKPKPEDVKNGFIGETVVKAAKKTATKKDEPAAAATETATPAE